MIIEASLIQQYLLITQKNRYTFVNFWMANFQIHLITITVYHNNLTC